MSKLVGKIKYFKRYVVPYRNKRNCYFLQEIDRWKNDAELKPSRPLSSLTPIFEI